MRFITKLLWFYGCLLLAIGLLGGGSNAAAQTSRPNILLIITDDQRWDSVGQFMPFTQARIFNEGITFTRAYATTPICNPSRATIFTGLYAHHSGVHENDTPLNLPTFIETLHTNGYYTGLVGKYLNSWDGTPRPEYDFWVCQDGTDEQNATYRNPLLNVNGVWTPHEGYVTYIERDYALQFLNTAVRKKKPFFLVLGTRAPHGPAFPAPGHENLYSDLAPYRPPNYNEEDVSDKPAWVRRQELLTPEAQQAIDEFRRAQLRTLWSLDQSIRAMLNYLKLVNQMDNTIIIFTSDHGFYWGEHRLDGKNQVYEEDIRVPLAVRYPPAFTPGTVDHHLVANIDIAPTILQLAGLPVPPTMDGKPLTQLNSGNWRNDLLIQGWPLSREFAAVHTGRFVYCETYSGAGGEFIELYDLDVDPYQLVNVRRERPYRDIVDQLNQRLDELLSQ